MEFNKTNEAKARSELCKDSAFCFEQILEAAHVKTAFVRRLTNHPSKMSKICWTQNDKLISDGLLWTHTHIIHTIVG